MCDPVIAPIAIGVASAGMGAMQSIAGYQQQQAQYQYEQQAAQYQYQVEQANATARYNQEMAAYEASQQAYQAQLDANAAAANRAYQYEQLQLRGEYDKARQQAQQLMIAKIKQQGQILSSGRTGKSIALLASDAEREYGRDLAALGTNLGYAADAYTLNNEQNYLDAKTANARAAAGRMIQPVKGIVAAPMVGPAPSAAGMVLGIGQSILGGISTGMSLSAPKGFSVDTKGLAGPSNPLSGAALSPGGAGGTIGGGVGYGGGALSGSSNPLSGSLSNSNWSSNIKWPK